MYELAMALVTNTSSSFSFMMLGFFGAVAIVLVSWRVTARDRRAEQERLEIALEEKRLRHAEEMAKIRLASPKQIESTNMQPRVPPEYE